MWGASEKIGRTCIVEHASTYAQVARHVYRSTGSPPISVSGEEEREETVYMYCRNSVYWLILGNSIIATDLSQLLIVSSSTTCCDQNAWWTRKIYWYLHTGTGTDAFYDIEVARICWSVFWMTGFLNPRSSEGQSCFEKWYICILGPWDCSSGCSLGFAEFGFRVRYWAPLREEPQNI